MKRRISKKKITLIIILSLILIFLLSLLFAPSLIEGMEKNKLKNEVVTVTNMLKKNELELDEINNLTKKSITTGKRRKVEKAVENYLIDIATYSSNILKISNDKKIVNALNTKTIETNTYDFSQTKEHLEKQKKELAKVKESLEKITNDKRDYIKKNTNIKELIELYNELLSEELYTDKYIKLSSITIENINTTIEAVNYLSDNKNDWKIENNNMLFTKRKKLEVYNSILEKITEDANLDISIPTLIKDDKAPNIEANNITITEGTSININERVKCIDEVDDEVECKIDGKYDVNTPGEYNLKISTTDKSNNKSEKIIKITVNKKIVYKAPYYTEVIRNQNTVIVYGLDENNEYTKIIRVMPCSVGRSGQDTPTGTFTTSDKYRWGGLYGGVWGQYSTRIVSDILFHSVPYFSQNPGDLEWEEYNKLGSPASLGCVRMTVRDVKWLYENCPSGMTVKIYDGNLPSGVSKPSAPKIDGTSPNKRWDPTDPDANNPWNK